ncbi:Maf family protein [Marinicella sp. W31]|uniref:Maf family protein n=1 Tax=Marinicella sp. W31 TaxID=3023713 RepID=UPI0037565AFA
MNDIKLILASASPRRKELLQQIEIVPHISPAHIDETQHHDEMPYDYCKRMAIEKATACYHKSDRQHPVLGADTVVVCDGKSLGKPTDEDNAKLMLQQLSNRRHQVLTSVCVIYNEKVEVTVSESQVVFDALPEEWIKKYIASGEPMDKAGAYGIQGAAAMWIKQINGSYSAIMGLPLFETAQILYKLGIITPLRDG